MKEPNLNIICKRCGHWVIGMSMEMLNNGTIDHTMVCHRCDADKFDTIYIHKVHPYTGPIDDETGEPLMPIIKSWQTYKFEGKIIDENM